MALDFFKRIEWYKEKDNFCVSDDPGGRVTSKKGIWNWESDLTFPDLVLLSDERNE